MGVRAKNNRPRIIANFDVDVFIVLPPSLRLEIV
jgi:hypothetical protein